MNIFGLGVPEMMVLGLIAVVLFGRKLPEVAQSLGQSVRKFKTGMQGLEHGVDDIGLHGPASRPEAAPTEAIRPPQRVAATAPKFEDAPATPPQV